MVGRESISSPNRRSPGFARVERQVAGGPARRTAYVPLKHDSERITERWARSGRKADLPVTIVNRQSVGKLVGGLSPRTAKGRLYRVAKRMAIKHRSTMTKRQLIAAIETAAGNKHASRQGH